MQIDYFYITKFSGSRDENRNEAKDGNIAHMTSSSGKHTKFTCRLKSWCSVSRLVLIIPPFHLFLRLQFSGSAGLRILIRKKYFFKNMTITNFSSFRFLIAIVFLRRFSQENRRKKQQEETHITRPVSETVVVE